MSAETVLTQIRNCHAIAKRNAAGISHEESLRSFEPAGNGLHWTLGHLVATRCGFLIGLGGEPVWTREECRPYDRHAPPMGDGRGAKPLADIWKAYDLTQERLVKAIEGIPPDRLAAKVSPETGETVGNLLASLGLHDSYHTGQIGLIRRLLGKPPVDL